MQTTSSGLRAKQGPRASRVLGLVVVPAVALVTVLAGVAAVPAAARPEAAVASAVATVVPSSAAHHRVSLRVVRSRAASGITVVAMGTVGLRGVARHRAFLQRWNRSRQRWMLLGTTRVQANHHYRVRGHLNRTSYLRVALRGYGSAGVSKWLPVTVPAPAPKPTPTPLPAYSGLTALSTECVIKPADSGLRCWGYNSYGSVGDGTTTEPHPDVYRIPGAWRSVDTSGYLTCGIKTDGTAWCWGYNNYGAVGDGTTTDAYAPVQVGTDNDRSQVQAGYDASCGFAPAARRTAGAPGATASWATARPGTASHRRPSAAGTASASSRSTPTTSAD